MVGISRVCLKICRKSTIIGTLHCRTNERTKTNMQNMSEHGIDVQSGSQTFQRLRAEDILPLLICQKQGKLVDVEHASDYEFTSWLRWNGIPFVGLEEWTFDSKCAIINHALRNGLKPRLMALPENCLGTVSQLFTIFSRGA